MESYCNTIQILRNQNAKRFRYHGIILQNYSDHWKAHDIYTYLTAAKSGMAARRFLMESECNTIQISSDHSAKLFRSHGSIVQHDSDFQRTHANYFERWNGREAILNGIIMQHYSDLMESQCKTIQISWNQNAKLFRSLDNTHTNYFENVEWPRGDS